MTAEERRRAFNTRLANWGDKTTRDLIDLFERGLMTLPPGTKRAPDVIVAQARVIVGFAIREASLAGMQLQARIRDVSADRTVLREDKPLVGVTATARRVVSDLRPREHITQRMAKVVADAPPAVAQEERGWDEITTEPSRPPR